MWYHHHALLAMMVYLSTVSSAAPRSTSSPTLATQAQSCFVRPLHAPAVTVSRQQPRHAGDRRRVWVMSAKPTLNQNTRWRLSTVLKDPSGKGKEVDAVVRFVEKQGYEPPQGPIFIERDSSGLFETDERGFARNSGTWALGEDKNDRKWGLWIWGLFEEPLYPYMYFSLGIKDTVSSSSTTSDRGGKGGGDDGNGGGQSSLDVMNDALHGADGKGVQTVVELSPLASSLSPPASSAAAASTPPSAQPAAGGSTDAGQSSPSPSRPPTSFCLPTRRLDIRFSHTRQDGQPTLSDGIVTYKLTEYVKADPLGLGGMVNVGEVVDAGRVSLFPLSD